MSASANSRPEGAGLPQVRLGPTGTQVTRLGLGGFHQLEISSEIVAEVVDAYLAEGGNYIETARNYGRGASEEKLARALDGRRERVVLSSKTGAATAEEARADVEASLKALRTDRIDFYFLHGVEPGGLDRVAGRGGAGEGLLAAAAEGLIGAVGMTSHHPEVYLEAFDRLPLAVILVWCNYLDDLNFPIIPRRVIPEARRRGIGVTAMKPLADGLLHGSVDSAIPYVLGAGADVAVVGANSPQQVRQAASAVRAGPADDARREAILRDALELGRYVCRRCGRCPPPLMETFRLEGVFDRQMIDLMPHGPAENALRKVLSRWFGKETEAREAFAGLGERAEELVAAAEGVECPYGIDVVRKARIATAKLTGGPVAFL